MARKLLRVAVALALAAVFASPALAVDFTFNGWYRVRFIAADNQDRLSTQNFLSCCLPGDSTTAFTPGHARDNWRFIDSVFRPTFVGKLDDNVQGLVQLDIPVFNQVFGGGGSQLGTGQIKSGAVTAPVVTEGNTGDFANIHPTDVNATVYWFQFKLPGVPGPWFVRAGRDNFFNPRGIIGQTPNLRETGIQVFGKVGPQLDLRLEWMKRAELDIADADDDDVYKFSGKWSPIKELTLEFYEVIQWRQRDPQQGANFRDYWTGLSAAGRWGIFHGTADFVYQTGTWNYSARGLATGTNSVGSTAVSDTGTFLVGTSPHTVLPLNRDQTVNAYMLWLTAGVTLGPVSVTGGYVFATGDKDQNDTTQKQFYAIGCQTTDSGTPGCDARAQGPTDLWFGDKYNDTVIAGSRNLGGNTGGAGGRYSRGNGNRTYYIDFALTPVADVVFNTTIAFIYSAEARPDITTNRSTPFVTDTYIGTEINVNAAWSLYKGFTLQGGFDYLAAGDYGILANKVVATAQDPGRLSPGTGNTSSIRQVNSNDNTWQAVFKMEWFF